MSSLQNIKTRISSVGTTKKITKAMELIAISKLRKAKENLQKARDYTDRVENVFLNLDTHIKNWSQVFNVSENNPRIFILISSDLGLCGGYNSNIFKIARDNITKDDFIIAIGSKGIRWVQTNFSKEKILSEYSNIGDDNYEMVTEITNTLITYLTTNKIRSIHLLYTNFINSLTYEVEDKKIFPFSRTERLKYLEANPINGVMEFEPNSSMVLRNSLPLYINAILFAKLANSKVSEMSSRRTAMENSSNNADELIDNLQKEYNKIRQSKITQEITEIVAGVDNG
ncbi:MAG: ATP synthase F1 subunit gamma [Metamycoplasmataceae bacterium]